MYNGEEFNGGDEVCLEASMDETGHRAGLLFRFPYLGKKLVRTDCGSFYLRCLYHQEDSLDVVEGCRKACKIHYELGGCHRLRAGCRLFCQSVLLSELCDSVFLIGKVPAYGRLSLCEQDELRTSYPADTPHHAAYTAHAAAGGLQIVYRMAALGLSAREGIRQGETE